MQHSSKFQFVLKLTNTFKPLSASWVNKNYSFFGEICDFFFSFQLCNSLCHMTSVMTEEDSISLAPLLEERHDTYKGYLIEYIRQPDTQVRCNLVLFYFLFYYNWQICRVRAQCIIFKSNVRLCDGVFVVISLKQCIIQLKIGLGRLHLPLPWVFRISQKPYLIISENSTNGSDCRDTALLTKRWRTVSFRADLASPFPILSFRSVGVSFGGSDE